jgi:CMP-N,N'-diacetyllegionaminic acid synthase
LKILITICARGGSKGLPNKNILKLNGKHLIAYTIEVAKKFKILNKKSDIVLSSDNKEIIEISKKYNLYSDYVRPSKFAGDDVGKLDAIRDVLFFYENKNLIKYDYVLDLDVTSPLRNIDDLTNAFEKIKSDKNALSIFSVSHPNRNPYFNMVEKKNNGYYNLVKSSNDLVLSRQKSPEVFDMNASFYFYKRDFFEKKFQTAITENSLIYLINHICFDIDDKLDFEIMEYLIKTNKLDFDL